MNGTTLDRPDVAAYLDAVRTQLADLPAEERDDLVADVEASLLESGESPTLSPEAFAAELREAAGLSSEAPPTAAQPSSLEALRLWLASERVASWRSTARELAPIWWLARAYVFVFLLGSLVDGYPLTASAGAYSLDWIVFGVLVSAAVSIWLGLRGRRGHGPDRRVSLAVNIVLALALWPAAALTIDRIGYGGYSEVVYAEPVSGLALDGVPIQNLYPYGRGGRPLFDVLLYDETGRPIDISAGSEDPARRLLEGEDGAQLYNSFPIRYYEPGTQEVARPELGPTVTVPTIVTPALEP